MIQVDLKQLLGRLNAYSRRSLEAAAGLCVSRGHYEVTIEHLLLIMADDTPRDLPLLLQHFAASTADQQRGETAMPDQTENEKAAAAFDVQLSAMLKSARKRSEQLWPGVVGQLEIAQHHLRSMMHPDDAEKAR